MKNKFRFFLLPLDKKASILEKNKLYFLAGILYMELKNYLKAAECFNITHSYRHLILVYQKLGLYSKAIEIADQKKYYKIGAAICEKINNVKKAAYFYSYFKPLYAARLYKNEHFFYEAGECYLKIYQLSSAIECFKNCEDLSKRSEGLKQLEEFAAVLYFTKHYDDAFKLFIKLGDYYSALECAKKLKESILIRQMSLLIGNTEAQNKNYLVAAKFTEPYDKKKALLYYYLGQAKTDAIRLLVEQSNYEKAFNLCIHHNDLDLAYTLANTYNIPLTPAACSG
jgi:tetratricopeptide (TPR) repeat protein